MSICLDPQNAREYYPSQFQKEEKILNKVIRLYWMTKKCVELISNTIHQTLQKSYILFWNKTAKD